MPETTSPRVRKTFSKLEKVLDVPNLIDIQKASFRWFMGDPSDPNSLKTSGLRETIDDISPIRDYSERLEVALGEYTIGDPVVPERECREKDLSYEVPVNVKVAFTNLDTGEIREQTVFLGNFPWMTDQGTFIINGTERVVVTQLVRSPGAYIMEPKDRDKQVFTANLMPSRGSWLELEIDKKGLVNVRIDRKRKLPITTLLRALPAVDENTGFTIDKTDEGLLALFGDNPFIRMTLEKDPSQSEEAALIEVFKKQRPGEPPTVDNSRNLVRALFFDPKRYDLTRVGRYKLNMRLGSEVSPECRVLTTGDIVELVKRLVDLPVKLGVPEESKDYAADASPIPRDAIEHDLDEYEHFGNRRLRTVGELIQEAFRIGLYRMERVVRERLTTEDEDAITPQTIVNIRPVAAALKEFFGSSQLSQFMDQTNCLAGLTHRRRLSALGAGGLTRERAPIEVRDVHPTHYGRMCPIETPEGPNIGLIGSLGSYAKVSEHGFVQTPYRKIEKGKVSTDIEYLDALQEEKYTIAQANAEIDKNGKLVSPVLCRTRDGVPVQVDNTKVDYMDVDPAQIVSVATALIPFLEHNDANRALMGSNMQRQAVPLMVTEAPLVGTGLEYRAAVDTGDVVLTRRAGKVEYVDAEKIIVATRDGHDQYDLVKYRRSNQGTLIHQKPIVRAGDRVSKDQVLADGSSTDTGELALGKNLLVAFMSWEGYNFEDAIILSERLVKDDVLSSIHIHEYEVDARSTKLGDEEITRDIPNRSEESLRNLDENGIVRIGAEVGSGDLLVGKVTPKGETELTAEEKLIRAIFKEKAREVRDTSLKVPHGEGGKVIDVKTFSRAAGDDLSPGVNELVRVYVATKRKIAEGDKLAGRHGNKGVISKIVPEEDMPFLEDGRPVDIILNPLGVPSRMNIGQILETHLGWAAAHGGENGERQFVATPVFDGATPQDVDQALIDWAGRQQAAGREVHDRQEGTAGLALLRQGAAVQRPQRGSVRPGGHGRLHVHPEAAAPGGRQDPRPLDRPLLAGHAAAAGRQGPVRRTALRRDGGVGARGIRRRVHPAGDADHQVRRHRGPGQGLRGDRQGREHPRAVDPGELQGAAEGDAVPGAGREGGGRGRRRRGGSRGGRRAAASRRGARHRPAAGGRQGRRPRPRGPGAGGGGRPHRRGRRADRPQRRGARRGAGRGRARRRARGAGAGRGRGMTDSRRRPVISLYPRSKSEENTR